MIANTTHHNATPQNRVGTVVLPPKVGDEAGVREAPVIYNTTAMQGGTGAATVPDQMASNATEASVEPYDRRQAAEGEDAAHHEQTVVEAEVDSSIGHSEATPAEAIPFQGEDGEPVFDNIEGPQDRTAGAPLPDEDGLESSVPSDRHDDMTSGSAGSEGQDGLDAASAITETGDVSSAESGTHEPVHGESVASTRNDAETYVSADHGSYDAQTSPDNATGMSPGQITEAGPNDNKESATPVVLTPVNEGDEAENGASPAAVERQLKSGGDWPMPMRRMFSASRFR